MSVRPDPVIPETRRRRASTTEKSERILKMSRSLTLTRSVLAGTLAEATPNQLDFIERWFTAELDSRERSKRLRLVFCQVGVGRFGVSFSPCERRVSGRFGVGRSCWLLVIALVIA